MTLLGGPSSLYMPFTAVKSSGDGGKFHRDDVRGRRPGEEWRLLKKHPRWQAGSVEKITAIDEN